MLIKIRSLQFIQVFKFLLLFVDPVCLSLSDERLVNMAFQGIEVSEVVRHC